MAGKSEDFRRSFRLYGRMLRFAKPYIPYFLLTILLSFFVVAFESVSTWVPATLIQALFNPEVAHEGYDAIASEAAPGGTKAPEIGESTDRGTDPGGFALGLSGLDSINEKLKKWTYEMLNSGTEGARGVIRIICLLIIVAYLLKNVGLYIQSLINAKLNLYIVRDMRNKLYRHILRLPVSYSDRNRSGDIVSRILNDVGSVNTSINTTFSKLIIEPVRLIAFIIILCIINLQMTLAIFILYPVLGFFIVKIGQAVRRRSKRTLDKISGLVSVLYETINGIRIVKMFNMSEAESRKFSRENQKFVRASFRSTRVGALSSPVTEILGSVVMIALLWYGGIQVLESRSGFQAEDFLRYLLFLLQMYRPLKSLMSVNNAIQAGFAGGERIFEVLDTEPEKLNEKDDVDPIEFKKSVRFENVDFVYPGFDEQVLTDISFSLDKGKIIALVGSSGSGKSTILDLVPRFYEPTRGRITLDDIDIRDLDLIAYRHLFGIVSQDTFLFNDSVYDNIAYGTENPSREDVLKAAEAANALEFIKKLPKGIDSVVGERGVTLSGGQRQRIAIARALLRNPPILILDEATSALDTESERLVQRAINNLMETRTSLVVAHRLSTIIHADEILVLENGRIVERGNHAELLALKRRYKYFHDVQFSAVGAPS